MHAWMVVFTGSTSGGMGSSLGLLNEVWGEGRKLERCICKHITWAYMNVAVFTGSNLGWIRLSLLGQYLMKFEERWETSKGACNYIHYNLVTWLSHNLIVKHPNLFKQTRFSRQLTLQAKQRQTKLGSNNASCVAVRAKPQSCVHLQTILAWLNGVTAWIYIQTLCKHVIYMYI